MQGIGWVPELGEYPKPRSYVMWLLAGTFRPRAILPVGIPPAGAWRP